MTEGCTSLGGGEMWWSGEDGYTETSGAVRIFQKKG